jgi:hypothetical protein
MITHEVDDVNHWLTAPVRAALVAKLGLDIRVYVDPASSNVVGVILEVPSVEFIVKHLNSAENKEAMTLDGVRPDTLRLLITP